MKPCYHCRKNPAQPRSNFCSECCTRPLFFPSSPTKGDRAKTALLYAGAALAATFLIYKTVEFVLTH